MPTPRPQSPACHPWQRRPRVPHGYENDLGYGRFVAVVGVDYVG